MTFVLSCNPSAELTAIIEQCGWLQELGVASGAVEQLNGLLRKLPGKITGNNWCFDYLLYLASFLRAGSGSYAFHL